ncbi:hypothetical protein SLEP1_g53798 [Rubroshorea leprosula]|uniref:Secreted protein n=1 Tax=Rubroshorea leprosula TaxID=152421 RepID=A0AAV5ME09_9ROSI|nr:hypothetical protein SLEP1_g53798 [Rubroshorea leprosula]
MPCTPFFCVPLLLQPDPAALCPPCLLRTDSAPVPCNPLCACSAHPSLQKPCTRDKKKKKAFGPLLSSLQKSAAVERLKGSNFGVLRINGGEDKAGSEG